MWLFLFYCNCAAPSFPLFLIMHVWISISVQTRWCGTDTENVRATGYPVLQPRQYRRAFERTPRSWARYVSCVYAYISTVTLMETFMYVFRYCLCYSQDRHLSSCPVCSIASITYLHEPSIYVHIVAQSIKTLTIHSHNVSGYGPPAPPATMGQVIVIVCNVITVMFYWECTTIWCLDSSLFYLHIHSFFMSIMSCFLSILSMTHNDQCMDVEQRFVSALMAIGNRLMLLPLRDMRHIL